MTSEKSSKYSAPRVWYTDNGSTVTIDGRDFKGAVDGGADKWRQESIKDSSAGSRRPVMGTGVGLPTTNLSPWYYYTNESTLTYSSTVDSFV